MLTYQPRRPVPWTGFDLLLVVLFYLTAQWAMGSLARLTLDPADFQPPAVASSTAHPLAVLLMDGGAAVLVLCFASAVVVNPIFEELMFSVLFQGWLEKIFRRRHWRAAGPIAISSLVFAAMHFRTLGPPMGARLAQFYFVGDAAVKLLVAAFAIRLLKKFSGACAADLGWTPGRLWSDVRLGLGAFVAVVVPIYALQIGLSAVLPPQVAPDPAPLFLFALLLGTIYYRTHRVAPLVALHAAFNGASLALTCLGRFS